MQRSFSFAALAALFVLTSSAFAAPAVPEERVPLPVCQPVVPPFATTVVAASYGTVLTLPEGKYQEPPAGLKPVSLPISVAYQAPDGKVSRIILIEGAENLKPGLVFSVLGKLGVVKLALKYVCHHLESRVVDVPVEGQVAQKQSVPYLCAWGPIDTKIADLAERVVGIVPPVEPLPTPATAPNPDLAPASAPAARTSELLGSDEPTPTVPGAALATTQRDSVLARLLATKSVGETMSLPDWVTTAPAKAPEGWGRYLIQPENYKTGQVVALIKRYGAQPVLWVRAVVVGQGDEPGADGQIVKVAYIWTPTPPRLQEGDKLSISTAVPPGCPGSAPPQPEPQPDHH